MDEPPEVPSATVSELSDDVVLLDVRRGEEWEAGHGVGALHIPDDELADRIAEITPGTEVFVACHGGGGRSTRMTAWLQDHGINARRLDGGLVAYAEAGLPMESDTGEPPVVD